MSIVHCPECQKEISNIADVCPNCGYPIKKCIRKSRTRIFLGKYGLWIALPLIIVVVIVLFIMINHFSVLQLTDDLNGNASVKTTPEIEVNQLYFDYFGKKYGWDNTKVDPMYSDSVNKYNVFLADLTHDGMDEMIVINDNLKYEEEVELTVYTCKNAEVEQIYFDRSTKMPRDKKFGLYYVDQLTYLLVCKNDFWMNGGTISYEVFTLSEDGDKKYLIQDVFSETIDPDNYDDRDPELYSYLDREEAAINKSKILFDSRSQYVCQSDPKMILSAASKWQSSNQTESSIFSLSVPMD